MSKLRPITLGIAIAVTVAACGTSPAADQPSSGVAGMVVATPPCPVEQRPISESGAPVPDVCRERPAAATIHVTEISSVRRVASAVAAADGRFSIPLDPGRYEVAAFDPRTKAAAGSPMLVEVRPDTFTEIKLEFDTGVR